MVILSLQEDDDTKCLSNVQLHRLLMREQLNLCRLQQKYFNIKIDEKQKMLSKISKRSLSTSSDEEPSTKTRRIEVNSRHSDGAGLCPISKSSTVV